ncbi:hypothetical protein J2W54_004922 [Rhodococcus fascians]|uniref:hypothetical protein n=1 Tax=Nocardiaceae TaxID=85025 RepID=UPI000B9C3DD1|nr:MULTISPECIES: hypothetical protein [Rhodococcus]MDR6912909.1 hypothetical protein [Rhodococcus sp. 3258]MDR6934506.1 hypothetical protein [Rhodococcus fascians]OZE33538.1 hypothetical protein CH278_13030 [Rhodococcus sp. 05-2254-5]OZE51057.1 hypothetical protein CH269_25975 [Rhodococcus sp. 05-2254-1]
MHDTITEPRTVGLHTAIMAAIGQVPGQVKTHALAQVTAYTEQVNRAAADANSTTVDAHLERAAYWACIARENGASEDEIHAARLAGHHRAATAQQ